MTSSSIQSIATSNPNILVTSDPSIRIEKKNAKLLNGSLIVLVIIALIGLAIAIFVALNKMNQNKAIADQAQASAYAVQHLTAQTISKKENLEQPVTVAEDDILFTLRTTPDGASVYQEGLFIGKTPIEDRKMKKSSDPSHFIISLNGYALERKTYTLDETFSGSEFIELTKDVVRTTSTVTAPVAHNNNDVMANDAVVITTQQENKPVRHNKKDKAAPAAPVDTGIVLPL